MSGAMSRKISLVIPLPVSVNAFYIGTGKNRRRSPKYSAWFEEAGWRVNEARAGGQATRLSPEAWYWTDVRVPLNHIGDSDNRLKALHDLLHEMGVTPDDRWLFGGTYRRCSSVDAGMCRVEAFSIGSDEFKADADIHELMQQVGIQ